MKNARPHVSKDECRYLGRNSCLAVWKNRPKDIIRVYVHKDLEREYSELLADCARHRRSYHIVGDRDLEKLTDSTHHQGIAIVARDRKPLREGDFFRDLRPGRSLVLYLDGVGNPHNLGAVLRTAAHFGVSYVCVPEESLPRVSPAAHRTSEGGAEFVSVVRVRETEDFFLRLKKMGFQIYGLEPGDKSQALYGTRISDRSLLVLGAEVTGISPLVKALMDTSVHIPGTGVIESLNVSVAAALAVGEFYRQTSEGSVRIVKK